MKVEYKGYTAEIKFSLEDSVYCGKIEGIPDLISFEGTDIPEAEKAFQEAVDEYITHKKQ